VSHDVKTYTAEGWSLVPIPRGEKGPRLSNWQHTAFSESDFKDSDNIGVKLGDPSGGLIDIDLDCKQAVEIAATLLPKTQRIHGRPNKRRSHYWYTVVGQIKSEGFKDIDGSMLVEIRSTGGQTVLPPSIHPSGEVLEWELDKTPLSTEPGLLRDSVVWVATASLLARHYPEAGSRHDAAGQIAGFLLNLKVPPIVVASIVEAAATAAGDPEIKDRVAFATSTVSSFLANEPVTGGPKLSDLIGPEVIKRIKIWFGTSVSQIQELNERHAIVFGQNGGLIVLTETTEDGQFQLRFSQPNVMTMLYPKMVTIGESSTGKPVTRPLGSVWLTHPKRRFYHGIELAPNGNANPGYYNLWRGFTVEPKKGSWQLYKEHLRLLAGNDPECMRYIFAWMAETVQHPDRPVGIALSFKGEQGTGKSTFCKWFGSLFGVHFMHLDSEQRLLGNFNAHLHNVIVVLADEAVWAGGKAGLGSLKRMITEETLAIERKGVDTMVVKNRMHMMVASNEDWFVPVGFDNRRFAVFCTSTDKQNNSKFFSAVRKELFEQGGLSALLYDLLEFKDEVELRDIPQTKELDEQKYRSMHSREAWWYDVLCDGGPWKVSNPINNKEYAVDPDELYADYVVAMQRGSGRTNLGMKGALGRFLRLVMPNPYPLSRQESGGQRKRYWVFPSLLVCRNFFAQKYWKKDWSSSKSFENFRIEEEPSSEDLYE
jgi:hypothetical protein